MSQSQISGNGRAGCETGAASALSLRGILLVFCACAELPFLAFLYDPTAIHTAPGWVSAHSIMREAVPFTLFFFAALALIMAPRRKEILQRWRDAAAPHAWRTPLVVNLLLFLVLCVATLRFNAASGLAAPPWEAFALWCAGAGAVYVALFLALAPLAFWRNFFDSERALIALGLGAAILIETAAVLSRQSWNALSEATFVFSTAILSLYEQNVTTIPEKRVIGVDGFEVNIAAACSGYEGIGLVLVFLAIYFWIFRSVLKFPNVFLILPVGVATIWILNSVRIAALVSLGAHVSPEIAISGFHSQAGWIMFLLVTIGIMSATHRIDFFHQQGAKVRSARAHPAAREATALLAPFLALTAASIVSSAFAGEGYWTYSLRVAAVGVAIFGFWRFYKAMNWRIGAEPVLLGFIVAAAWIATDTKSASPSALGDWIASLSPAAIGLWLSLRLMGTIILVPLAEELAFRGYLHRKLIAERFETVAESTFSWKAFAVTSVLFGVLHERWLSGMLAGAVFALAMYRSGKLAGAVAAHVTANAAIAFWAVAFSQWSLL
ncbi:exosortase E/protease, VPEID-CTERM system [Hyphococcus sp.]|uniref:exosortase E/protease, VPEID-CTERM system n=1 Tax=Hyphococcus sp. TaxID=2038636 RepID=UPI003CCBC9F1